MKQTLVDKYRKMAMGGAVDPYSAIIQTGMELGGTAVDAIDPEDEYGVRSKLGSIAAGNFKGGTIGAAISYFGNQKAKRQRDNYLRQRDIRNNQNDATLMGAQLAVNPELYQGNQDAQYFKNGGSLSAKYIASQYATGGTITQQSSDGAEVSGNTHAQGGVKVPSLGAELENGETTKGDYVFSEDLGFAKLHRPLMKAKGVIEAKPPTVERINSLKRINEREEGLKLSQEYMKSQLNLQ